MKTINCLAVDVGAGNGKIILSSFDGKHIKTDEIYRFANKPVMLQGTLFWNLLSIMEELYTGLAKAAAAAKAPATTQGEIRSIGIDTWGADFGLIDAKDNLISQPLCYRNNCISQMAAYVFEIFPPEILFELTNSRTYPHTALFQLYYLYRFKPELAGRARTLLPIPNLINLFLCGEKCVEPSGLSGSQFFNVKNREPLPSVLEKCGIPGGIIPEIRNPGILLGGLDKKSVPEIGIDPAPDIVLVCGHDTASAVAGIPFHQGSDEECFLICGTWSIIGCVTRDSYAPSRLLATQFTNWNGYLSENLLVRIFSGLYFIQECRTEWEREEGRALEYDELYRDIIDSDCNGRVIDLTIEGLFDRSIGMVPSLVKHLKSRSNSYEYSRKNLVSIILRSMVAETVLCCRELELLLDVTFPTVYFTGGGSRITLLAGWLADALKKTIIAIEPETAIHGNTLVQLCALGCISGIEEGRIILESSYEQRQFTPETKNAGLWEDVVDNYRHLKSGY